MKQPSILDVIQGVKTVAPAHPEVDVWWYAPPVRLRLGGELPRTGRAPASIELVVEGAGMTCAHIAQDLSRALSDADVTVRVHVGEKEERQLFRILSRDANRQVGSAPRPA